MKVSDIVASKKMKEIRGSEQRACVIGSRAEDEQTHGKKKRVGRADPHG